MALDEQTYFMHRQSVEGEIFYKNKLTEPENVKTYFPVGVDEETYEQSPKISFPVTSDILNRIKNLLHNGLEITCEVPIVQEKLTALFERNDWKKFGLTLIVKAMGGGNLLVVFRTGWPQEINWNDIKTARDIPPQVIYFETWPGKFIFRDNYFMSSPTLGYMYIWKDGKRQPILSEPTRKDFENGNVRIISINDNYWWEDTFSGEPVDLQKAEHGFGFTPAFFLKSIDEDDDGRYGIPYHFRFRENLIEYNQIYSQASKALKILQNVWVTDQQIENPYSPIRLTPDKINLIGEGGKLEQVIRNLDIEPELTILDRLRNHIAVSAEVPEFFTGLKSVGKIESGVALSIVSAPLTELINNVRETFKTFVNEMLTKAIRAEFALQRLHPPDFELEITMNESVIPIDREKEIANIEKAINLGMISIEEAKPRMLQLLNMEDVQ